VRGPVAVSGSWRGQASADLLVCLGLGSQGARDRAVHALEPSPKGGAQWLRLVEPRNPQVTVWEQRGPHSGSA
jgi:hypothetical protein